MIREANINDIEYLTRLYEQLGVKGINVSVDFICFIQRSSRERIFVYDLNGKVVGCITAYVCSDPSTCCHFGMVDHVCVDEAFRRQHIGQALVTHAEAWCRGFRCHSIRLVMRTENEVAIQFYRKLGYLNHNRASLRKYL